VHERCVNWGCASARPVLPPSVVAKRQHGWLKVAAAACRLANSPVVRELVNEELQHRGTATIAFQILGVDEIERAWRSIRKRGLTALLAAKMSASDQADPDRKYASVADYLSSFSSLSDFLSRVAEPDEQPTMPPLLEARWKALMTSLRAQFSPAG